MYLTTQEAQQLIADLLIDAEHSISEARRIANNHNLAVKWPRTNMLNREEPSDWKDSDDEDEWEESWTDSEADED